MHEGAEARSKPRCHTARSVVAMLERNSYSRNAPKPERGASLAGRAHRIARATPAGARSRRMSPPRGGRARATFRDLRTAGTF